MRRERRERPERTAPALVPYVGVAGASQPEQELVGVAEVLGRRLAEAGAVVVCGGGTGVMAAVCRGVAAVGGTSIGLLPGDHRRDGNPYLGVALTTGLGEGTLSEIALALRIGVPVVGLRTWSLGLEGRPVDAFPVATDPAEAARLALASAAARMTR